MTEQVRNKVRKTAIENGYRQSSTDKNVMINNNGDKIKEVGSNRTIYNGNTHYGSKSITDALNN